MSKVFRVGMSEVKIAYPPDTLSALGLGSCIGLCIYDPQIRLGGMAHIMLPDSSQARERSALGKFADTSVPYLVREMERLGAHKRRMIVKIVGGAQMFSISGQDDRLSIGARNIEAVQKALKNQGLTISAQSVGGNMGKTITLDPETGQISVRTINSPVIYL
jgi:chemotaxis protein CheD